MTAERIAQVIGKRLADGTYAPGTVVPAARSLAVEFGVSVWTVRRALQPFTDSGALHPVIGRGTLVRDPTTSPVARGAREVSQIVRERLQAGTYAVGTWLPPQTVLAVEFGVSASTVHVAMTSLKREKLVETLTPLGTYVLDPRKPCTAPPGTPSHVRQVIRERLRDGTYPPGSPLPTIPELAAGFNAGPNTVARALNLLRSEGLVYRGQHRRFFAARPASEPSGPDRERGSFHA
ncbi:GntR family transcriptional regulator [Streptomyces sp. NPDC058656]|uniref:GntR family transcriptional regulator n=1 Tax=unclassified Streptomyces TaxID=2593676 RepID=UPI0036621072